MKTKLLLLSLLSLFLHGTVRSQTTEENLMTKIQNILDTKISIYGMEGVGASIVFPSGNIQSIKSGYSTSINTPVNLSKKWHWASGTKPLTGYVILDMYEDGLLDINKPISNYIDTNTTPNVSGTILVKDLLQHTSPLQDFWTSNQPILWNAVWSNRTKVWCPSDVLSYMPNPTSNNTHSYNDSNSLILGVIIEAISGKSLENVFQERIFTPLAMNNSFLSSCKTIDMNDLNGVWNGNENRSTWSHTSYLSSRGGNSALIATIEDVAKFYHTYYKGDLLSNSLMDELRTPSTGSLKNFGTIGCVPSVKTYYGFETTILEVTNSKGTHYLYGHGGNGINNSFSYHWKEENITIVIVTNDYTTLNTIGALFADIFCEIDNNLPIQTLSNNEEEEIPIVTLYPNPFKNQINIKLKTKPNEQGKFILRDINGRKILKSMLSNKNTTLPISNITSGIYFYELIVDGKNEIGKIIKE